VLPLALVLLHYHFTHTHSLSDALPSHISPVGYLLAQPSVSIPLGTLSSTLIVVFLVTFLTFVLSLGVSYHGLSANRIPLALLSWPMPILGYIGITLCNIAAAFNNLKGIPRLLAVINEDGAVPFFSFLSVHHHPLFTLPSSSHAPISASPRGPGTTAHPRYLNSRKVLFTFLITAVPCLAGDLKLLAEAVAIPALLVSVGVNMSCFLLAFVKAPGFRPHWKYFRSPLPRSYFTHFRSWHTALLGTLWCVVAMLIVSWWIAIMYTIALLILIFMVSKSTASNDWGDALSGLMYQQVSISSFHPPSPPLFRHTYGTTNRHEICCTS
jgi:hypothetical protein